MFGHSSFRAPEVSPKDRLEPEDHAKVVHGSAFISSIAAENGRLYAARVITENPEQRKKVEDAFGLEVCKYQWPEAYQKGKWRGLLKFIPDLMNPFRER